MIQIIIIDDDPLVALSLKTILEHTETIQVLATGNSGAEATCLYFQYHPDVLLMDIQMEAGSPSGLDAAEQILNRAPEARILFLTTFSDDAYIAKALQIGAKGYLIKQNFNGIAPALEAVLAGQYVFGEPIIPKLTCSPTSNAQTHGTENPHCHLDILTETEQKIFVAVAEGYNNREIADQLCFSEGTIRNYLSSILEKLHLRDRTQLAIFYYTRG